VSAIYNEIEPYAAAWVDRDGRVLWAL